MNVFVNGFIQLLRDKFVEKMVLLAIIGLLNQKLLSKKNPQTKKKTPKPTVFRQIGHQVKIMVGGQTTHRMT